MCADVQNSASLSPLPQSFCCLLTHTPVPAPVQCPFPQVRASVRLAPATPMLRSSTGNPSMPTSLVTPSTLLARAGVR